MVTMVACSPPVGCNSKIVLVDGRRVDKMNWVNWPRTGPLSVCCLGRDSIIFGAGANEMEGTRLSVTVFDGKELW